MVVVAPVVVLPLATIDAVVVIALDDAILPLATIDAVVVVAPVVVLLLATVDVVVVKVPVGAISVVALVLVVLLLATVDAVVYPKALPATKTKPSVRKGKTVSEPTPSSPPGLERPTRTRPRSETGSAASMEQVVEQQAMDEIQYLETRLAVLRDRHGLPPNGQN